MNAVKIVGSKFDHAAAYRQQPYILRDPDGRVLSRVAKTAPLSWQTRQTTERTDYTFAVLFPTYMGASRAAQGQGGTPELLPAEL